MAKRGPGAGVDWHSGSGRASKTSSLYLSLFLLLERNVLLLLGYARPQSESAKRMDVARVVLLPRGYNAAQALVRLEYPALHGQTAIDTSQSLT